MWGLSPELQRLRRPRDAVCEAAARAIPRTAAGFGKISLVGPGSFRYIASTSASGFQLPSMSPFRNGPQGSPASVVQPSLHRDLIVVGAVTLLTFVLSSAFQLNEWIESLTGPHEAYQVDELPLTVLAMAMGLAWFSWRRSKQVMEQVALRLGSEEQYRALASVAGRCGNPIWRK